MHLVLAEKEVKNGNENGGAWFPLRHKKDVLSISTKGNGVFATCDAGGLCVLWRHVVSANNAGPINLGSVETEGPAVVDSCFSHNTRLCTAQGDGTVGVWDMETAQRLHSLSRLSGLGRTTNWPVINAVAAVENDFIAFGGDDGFLVLGSHTEKNAVAAINLRTPITSLAASSDSLFVGDVLGNVRCFDSRMLRCIYKLRGHRDVVSSVALNNDATNMVSYGMDNLLILWDVMPFALSVNDRLLQRIEMRQGDTRNLLRCSWSKGEKILLPTEDGQIVCVSAPKFTGAKMTLPRSHRTQPARCAVFAADNVAVSSAGPEVIVQLV